MSVVASTNAVFADDPAPVMNTTPLIDVLLVLLILFIITIPIQTHAVRIDLPGGVPVRAEQVLDRNRLILTEGGTLSWNGQVVDRPTLRAYLEIAGSAARPPSVEFQPAPGARYEIVDEVLAMARRANIVSLGFIGNEQYRAGF